MDEMPYYDAPQTRRKRKSRKWIVLLFLLIVLALGGVAAYKFLPSVISPKQKTTIVAPTPTDFVFPTDTQAPSGSLSTTPSPAPSGKTTPSPSPKITGKVTPTTAASTTDKGSITIMVENGSGITGAAAKMASYLKGLGYTVSGTGNAATNDYTNVTIQVKKSKSTILPGLKKDLSSSYTVDSTSTTLPETSSTDAVVIVGK